MRLALRPIILEKTSVQLRTVKHGSTVELPYLRKNKLSHINFHKNNDEQKVSVSWITKHTLLFILSFM